MAPDETADLERMRSDIAFCMQSIEAQRAINANQDNVNAHVDARLGQLEITLTLVQATCEDFRMFPARTDAELAIMRRQLDHALVAVDAVLDVLENGELRNRALSVRRSVRNRRTRAANEAGRRETARNEESA